MKISIVTDEISADPETAFEIGGELGITAFELRGIASNRAPLLTPFQKARLQELLDAFDVQIAALSPGLFKMPYVTGQRNDFPVQVIDYGMWQQWQESQDEVRFHLEELLPQSIQYARELGVNLIVAFSFHRGRAPSGTEPPEEVLEALHRAATQVGEAGMKLALEVEDGFWADTGKNTASILSLVDHPALVVNWDPGNAYPAGETPFPDGYEFVREAVHHVHFKDVRRNADGSHQYAVDGEIDWEGQLRALLEDGYDGYISVETHMRPKVAAAKDVTRRLQALLEKIEQD